MPQWIDLRSDTVTRPTPAMRRAMAEAEVGDDVYDDDPTVHRLQQRVAELLGKEAALFVPSGTMSNQIGLRVHTEPGDEIICEVDSHIYNYEAGGPAVLAGLMCRTVAGDHGVFTVDQIRDWIRPDDEHCVRTRLVCVENTHNRGGGRIFPLQGIEEICRWAHDNGLRTHLDGARLMNAVVATGIPAPEWTRHFDTVSICFSKGLGAPIGSALAGPRDLIAKGRRIRKLYGGGMRQVGVIAAAALYAIDHHIDRLAEDHANARLLADAIENSPGLSLAHEVQTNLVFFDVDPNLGSAEDFVSAMQEQGVLARTTAPGRIRLVTHLDVSRSQAERAAAVIEQLARQRDAVVA